MSDITSVPTTSAPEGASQESSQVEQNTQDSPPKAEPTKPEKKFRKLVVDGQEEVVDEDEVWKDVQKYRAADKRMKEAAAIKKQMGEFVNLLKSDPRAVLSNPKLGVDLKSFAEQILREELERELADPRDLKAKELEEELKSYRDREAEEKETKSKKEWEESVEKSKEEVAGILNKALETTVLAKDPTSLRAAAYYMRQCMLQGVEATPEEIVGHIENLQLKNYLNVAQKYDGEQLARFLGEEVVKKLQKHSLESIRKARATAEESPFKPAEPKQASPKSQPEHTLDRHSAAEMARKKLGL